MGTITQYRRKDGSTGYTGQIVIKRKGKVVHREAKTFDRKQAAKKWMSLREGELSAPGALEIAKRPDPTLAEAIDRYMADYGAMRTMGRTKIATLNAIKRSRLGGLQCSDVTSDELVTFARNRISDDGVTPQTVNNDMAHLGAVFSIAEAAYRYPLSDLEMRRAKIVLKKMGMVRKSRERDRRPTLGELDALMQHFADIQNRRPTSVNMLKVVAFAIFSTRRQDEIVRIRWDDLDDDGVLVRSMKHPGQTEGNDVWCRLPEPAMAIIRTMPRQLPEIFPYSSDSISASFTRACKFLGIEDLRFHDLRHDGISYLFECGWDIPQAASVSGHRSWDMMRRYTHLKGSGDKYEGWPWLQRALDSDVQFSRKTVQTTRS